MARPIPVWFQAFVSTFAPLLLAVAISTSVLGIWTVTQPPAPAQAWHKRNPQPFLSSIRNDAAETFCVNPDWAWNGQSDWWPALEAITDVLYRTPGVEDWDGLGEYRVNFIPERSVPCGYSYQFNRVHYHIRANSQDLCGWGQDPDGGWWHAGCVFHRDYAYSVGGLDAYSWSDVYLDQGHVCCLPGQPSGWRSGLLYQHVNHETGHVLGLADPNYRGDCVSTGSIMHQRIEYWCWDIHHPNWWDQESVRNIIYL